MNVERLQQLRRVLEAVPAAEFEMARFTTKSTCGTRHCAAGRAALDPWFQANTEILDIFSIRPRDSGLGVEVIPIHKNTFVSLAELFDIDLDNAKTLFGAYLNREDEGFVDKLDVIANIDAVLAGEQAEDYLNDPCDIDDDDELRH